MHEIATAAASLTFGLGTNNPVALGLALLGSQLPDLDTTTSTIGQICFPLSNWLEDNFPHRSITHSLLATVTLAAIAIFLLIFGIWIADNGGIFQNLGQNLSLDSAVVKVYNQNAATNHVYAEIQGFWSSDRSKADGKYLILGNEGKEFIVTDGEGVYVTGAEIITSKVKTVIGSESENIIKTLSFNDEQATPQLNELKEKYPANLIVITGELTIDLPDKIDNYDTNTKTFNLSGNRLTFNNCLLDDAIAYIQELRLDN